MKQQSGEQGDCGKCRHINCETEDFHESGMFWMCRFGVPIWANGYRCSLRYEDTGEFVFAPYDGSNCSWSEQNVTNDAFDGRRIVPSSEWEAQERQDHHQIAELAYSLWEKDGRPSSDGASFWYEAVRILYGQ